MALTEGITSYFKLVSTNSGESEASVAETLSSDLELLKQHNWDYRALGVLMKICSHNELFSDDEHVCISDYVLKSSKTGVIDISDREMIIKLIELKSLFTEHYESSYFSHEILKKSFEEWDVNYP